MDPIIISIGSALVASIFAGGAAWGGAKSALNGTRKRVEVIEKKLDQYQHDTTDRLARVETTLKGKY